MSTPPTLPRLHHQRGCDCPSCYEWRIWDRSGMPPVHLLATVKPAIATTFGERKEPAQTLVQSLARMMAEYIEGARKLPPEMTIGTEKLEPLFAARLARYISADQIAQIISEDASLQNGSLNVGYLAVKIAETIEGKRNPTT